MQKVLIYGFGHAGKACLLLCEQMGFKCQIVDDNLDYKEYFFDDRFIALQELNPVKFDIVLVAIFEGYKALLVKEKLVKIGFLEDCIKHFHEIRITSSMVTFFKQQKLSKKLLCEFFGDVFEMPQLHNALDIMIKDYYAYKKTNFSLLEYKSKIDSVYKEESVFAKIYKLSPNSWDILSISYPGFNVWNSMYSQEDKDFYFVKKIDFEFLSSRSKDIKLMVVFGNSALRVEYLRGGDL